MTQQHESLQEPGDSPEQVAALGHGLGKLLQKAHPSVRETIKTKGQLIRSCNNHQRLSADRAKLVQSKSDMLRRLARTYPLVVVHELLVHHDHQALAGATDLQNCPRACTQGFSPTPTDGEGQNHQDADRTDPEAKQADNEKAWPHAYLHG